VPIQSVKIVEVERVVEIPVEKIVYVDRPIVVEKIREVEVEKIIEREVPVYVDKVVTKEEIVYVDRVVEKPVFVEPIEKIVTVEKIVEVSQLMTKIVSSATDCESFGTLNKSRPRNTGRTVVLVEGI
jgi:hypothetical protein